MITLFYYTNEAYANDAVTINVDTAYLHWNNTFPAVSLCMTENSHPFAIRKIQKFVVSYYKEHNITEPSQYVSISGVHVIMNITPFAVTLVDCTMTDSICFIVFSYDFYYSILRYLFVTPTRPIPHSTGACSGINNTCGVDIEVLKKLVRNNNCASQEMKLGNEVWKRNQEIKKIRNCSQERSFLFHAYYIIVREKSYVFQVMPRSCKEIISAIQFSDSVHYEDCEDLFKLQLTEIGHCFTANGVYFYQEFAVS